MIRNYMKLYKECSELYKEGNCLDHLTNINQNFISLVIALETNVKFERCVRKGWTFLLYFS